MSKLGDLYSDFSLIDSDTRGGYARVTQARIANRLDIPEYCAFKVIDHELADIQKGMDRFETELQTLIKITKDVNSPSAIMKIYDSGFVDSKVSFFLQKPNEQYENTFELEKIDPEFSIISTGIDLRAFLEVKSVIEKDTDHWFPYLAIELAPYNNSLLRQIHRYYNNPTANSHLFSVGEVLSMALQLLDAMEYLQQQGLAYMDWKPEHIYWDNCAQKVKLIDWNSTKTLQTSVDQRDIIREGVRLFCGAALYCSMALSDPEDMQKPIGPKPKINNNPASFVHRRYWTDDPIFYERDSMFDNNLKQLVKKGLDPTRGFNTPQKLRNTLLEYIEKRFNSSEKQKIRIASEYFGKDNCHD